MRDGAWRKTEPHFEQRDVNVAAGQRGPMRTPFRSPIAGLKTGWTWKLWWLHLQRQMRWERLFSNFWSAAERPQPGRQSAYRRLKERRNALTLGPAHKDGAQLVLRPNTAFLFFFLFASSLPRAPPPFLHFCPTRNQKHWSQ